MTSKKNPLLLFSQMEETQEMTKDEVVEELSMLTFNNKGIQCPVPNCANKTKFVRWGDLREHFLDTSTHKKDYFEVYFKSQNQPFCDSRGAGFNHGLNSLILSLVKNPVAINQLTPSQPAIKGIATPSARPKRARPLQEQQSLPEVTESPAIACKDPLREDKASAQTKFKDPNMGKSPFARLSEQIRDSDQINKIWRAKVWDEYVDMFHGIPPCFHCRAEEGKQIHHQNPLFHEIILMTLNKLGTTAEMVVSNTDLYNQVLIEVFAFHMKTGKVCAVPYCQGCNQDAEMKRKRKG